MKNLGCNPLQKKKKKIYENSTLSIFNVFGVLGDGKLLNLFHQSKNWMIV